MTVMAYLLLMLRKESKNDWLFLNNISQIMRLTTTSQDLGE